MKRAKFTGISVELGAVTIEGFKNVAQAEAFHEELKKATLKVFRKVTDMPKELDPESFEAMPAIVNGIVAGTDGAESFEIELSELDGMVKLRKAGEPTPDEPTEDPTEEEQNPPDPESSKTTENEPSQPAGVEEGSEGEPEKPHAKRGRKQTEEE